MPFSEIAIIGGVNDKVLDDVEVISIHKGSISHINSSIPSLPKGLFGLGGTKALCGWGGTQLPNGDLLLRGGLTYSKVNNQYLHIKKNPISGLFRKGLHCKFPFYSFSIPLEQYFHPYPSVWIDGRLLTTGSCVGSTKNILHVEEFCFDGGKKMRKEFPIVLDYHTANIFEQNKSIVCGGLSTDVSKTFSKPRFEK